MCQLWLSRLCFQRLRAAEGGKTAGFLFGREGGVAFSSGDTMSFFWTYAFIRMALDSKANFIISTGLTPGLPFRIRQCIHGRERANLWSGYPRISYIMKL